MDYSLLRNQFFMVDGYQRHGIHAMLSLYDPRTSHNRVVRTHWLVYISDTLSKLMQGCAVRLATVANTAMFCTLAIGPALLSPISEELGRKPMLIGTGIVWLLSLIPQALAQNITMVIVFRVVQGVACSGANTLVGGLVADVFVAEERAFPLASYALAIFYGQAVGAIAFAWVNAGLGFRWVNWIQMILGMFRLTRYTALYIAIHGLILKPA